MQTSGNVPRITGLNAFGQPFRGRRIHGVGKAERDAGYAYGREQTSMRGPLANRGGNQAQFAERKMAEAEEAGETHRNRMAEEAAERGREKAKAAAGTAPKKREGMLVPGPGGSAVWKTGEELDRAERGKARAEARKRMGTEGSKTFVGPMPSVEMQQAKRAKDRAYARWRVQSEAYIHDPKWGEGMDPKETARHRASLMKIMAEEKTKNEFMDYPPHYGNQNVPSKTPQTAREWDEVSRKPLY